MIRPIFCIKIGKAIYYNLNYLESGVFKASQWVPACVNTNYAVFTNHTDIGKLYTGLNPLYSLLRLIAIFYKRKTLFISIHFILQDISQYNLTTISICVCHSVDILVAVYSQKLR